ncbi:MAG: flagellar hook capping FlgD N-terminal domain-containing protein [Pseudomonadota bacterium]
MTVSAIGASTTSTNSLYNSGTQTLGKDDFLKLLVTQLQNQDPLNPTDSTEFVSQLAQFSSLEQLSNVNDNLKTVQLFDQSINNAQAVNFVGKTIKATGSMFELGSGETHEIQYQLGEDADAVYVSIYNTSGEVIKKIEMDQMTAGVQSVVWDGKDVNGNAMPAGTYSFSVQAKNTDGEIMVTAAYIKETVTGVSYHNGNTYLLAKGIEIPYSAIIEVAEPEKK